MSGTAGVRTRGTSACAGGLVLAATLGACGGTSTLGAQDAGGLHGRVADVRAAVEQDAFPQARTTLSALRTEISTLVERDQVEPRDAVLLLAQIDRVSAELDAAAQERKDRRRGGR